jgi:hypothetical protein
VGPNTSGNVVAATGAMMVASDSLRIVRASIARPRTVKDAELRTPFEERAIGIVSLSCLDEGLLLAGKIGRRIGQAFRRKRAHARLEGLVSALTWKERDKANRSAEPMQCGVREF